jgi:hypothetical protein
MDARVFISRGVRGAEYLKGPKAGPFLTRDTAVTTIGMGSIGSAVGRDDPQRGFVLEAMVTPARSQRG